MRRAIAIIAFGALALAGCKQHSTTAGPGDAPAEVLPGSASDAMIQYDSLRSQPPLAVPTQAAHLGGGAQAPAEAASDAAAAPSNAAAPPAPAETAAPPG